MCAGGLQEWSEAVTSSQCRRWPGGGMPWSDLKRTTRWATFSPMTQAAVPRQRVDEPLEPGVQALVAQIEVESSREPLGLVARLTRPLALLAVAFITEKGHGEGERDEPRRLTPVGLGRTATTVPAAPSS